MLADNVARVGSHLDMLTATHQFLYSSNVAANWTDWLKEMDEECLEPLIQSVEAFKSATGALRRQTV